MSLNVNYTSLYKNGIDKSMLAEVSKEILNRAEAKSTQYAQNYSPAQVNSTAKPVELGLDLYQGKLDTTVQKQISINNTLQFQLNNETLKSNWVIGLGWSHAMFILVLEKLYGNK